jgi:hypothetical protein
LFRKAFLDAAKGSHGAVLLLCVVCCVMQGHL